MPRVAPPISLAARLRAGLVPAGHDHVATFVGIGLRELAAEPLRAADDDDAAVRHSLSPFVAGRPGRAQRVPGSASR